MALNLFWFYKDEDMVNRLIDEWVCSCKGATISIIARVQESGNYGKVNARLVTSQNIISFCYQEPGPVHSQLLFPIDLDHGYLMHESR